MVRKIRWCLTPVARLFVCVCCPPDLSSYDVHGYVSECASGVNANGGMLARGAVGRPAGRTAPDAAKTGPCTLPCPATSLVLSQSEASASDRAVCNSVWTPVLTENETHRETGPAKPIRVWVRCEAPQTSSRRRRAHLLRLASRSIKRVSLSSTTAQKSR